MMSAGNSGVVFRERCVAAVCMMIIVTLLTSCRREKAFNRELWLRGGEGGTYPERESMVKDLTVNHQLKGLQVADIRKKLGPPDETDESDNKLLYIVNTYYRHTGIDPVGSSTLVFWFEEDSTIIHFELQKEEYE